MASEVNVGKGALFFVYRVKLVIGLIYPVNECEAKTSCVLHVNPSKYSQQLTTRAPNFSNSAPNTKVNK
jgi:hypothetical protein